MIERENIDAASVRIYKKGGRGQGVLTVLPLHLHQTSLLLLLRYAEMGITKNEQGYYKMLEFPPGSIQDLYARQGIEMTVVHNSQSWRFFPAVFSSKLPR